MRLEQDYDSMVAAVLVVCLIASAAFNPFQPIFNSLYLRPVSRFFPLLLRSQLPFLPFYPAFRVSVVFDSFFISIGFALSLIFRNISFGAVAEIQNGTMAGFVVMPGGRKAAFISVIISGAVLPYLLSAVSIAVAIYLSGATAGLSGYLLAVGVNLLPVMGLAAVTLGAGAVTGRSITSFGLGVIYVLLLALGAAVLLSGRNAAVLQLMGFFIPSYAVLVALSSDGGLLLIAGLLISGLVFNGAMLYLAYYYWVRLADFRHMLG